MSALLVDAGNTRVKWALEERSMLAHAGAIAHGADDWCDALGQALRELPVPRSAWLASVAASDVTAQVCATLDATFPGVPVMLVRSTSILAGVRNGYAEPERLGVDRLLALAGAQSAHLAPALVVGVGTATTIDALRDGEHLGGLILPSADAMRGAVLAGTQVRAAHAGSVAPFARSTEDALASGPWIALAAAVERSADALAREVGRDATIVLHGGGAATLAGLLARPYVLREQLVLEGLAALVAHENR